MTDRFRFAPSSFALKSDFLKVAEAAVCRKLDLIDDSQVDWKQFNS